MKWAIYDKDNHRLYELVSYNKWVAQNYRGTDGSTLVHNAATEHKIPLPIVFSILDTLYLYDVDFSAMDKRGRLPEEGARKSVVKYVQELRKAQLILGRLSDDDEGSWSATEDEDDYGYGF